VNEKVEESTNDFAWSNPVSQQPVVEESKTVQDDSKKYFMLTESTEEKVEEKSTTVSNEVEASNEAEAEKSYSTEDQQKLNLERLARIRELNAKLKTTNGLNDLESEPAYKRRNITLNNVSHSSESQVSRFSVGNEGDGKSGDIKTNNSFLHDNVD
jgi:cell division protein FtsZ